MQKSKIVLAAAIFSLSTLALRSSDVSKVPIEAQLAAIRVAIGEAHKTSNAVFFVGTKVKIDSRNDCDDLQPEVFEKAKIEFPNLHKYSQQNSDNSNNETRSIICFDDFKVVSKTRINVFIRYFPSNSRGSSSTVWLRKIRGRWVVFQQSHAESLS